MSDAAAGSPVPLTPAALRGWPLPERTGSKDERGGVLVVGGARRTPGAVLLCGVAALRVGAGRLTLAAAGSVAPTLAVAVPEAGVLSLPESADGSVRGAASVLDDELARADAVVVGPGLDEPDGTLAVLEDVCTGLGDDTVVLLDAFALGVLRDARAVRDTLAGRLVLTPNTTEATHLLGGEDVPADRAAPLLAERYGAVVACTGTVADADGHVWASASGYSGLGTSGSGDVLAGAVAGLLAGGADAAQATCWGVALHATAGDRLAARVGPLGYLARELLTELPRVLVELQAR